MVESRGVPKKEICWEGVNTLLPKDVENPRPSGGPTPSWCDIPNPEGMQPPPPFFRTRKNSSPETKLVQVSQELYYSTIA